MASTLNQINREKRVFGREITNLVSDNITPGNVISNANTVKDQQLILKQIHKSRSQMIGNENGENNIRNGAKHGSFLDNINEATLGVSIENNEQESKLNAGFCDNLDLKSIDLELQKLEKQDKHIPECVTAYTRQIFAYMRNVEKKHQIQSSGMAKQREITEKMRAILIDWLIDVHQKYKMLPETMFITVLLLDKYLEKNQCARQNLQLLGVTCLFIAAKYEEIYPPQLKDFVDITDKTYTRHEVLDMEGKILLSANFQLTFPSSLRFLERYSKVYNQNDQKGYMLARYLIELAMLDIKFISYSQSNIASSALYLSNKIYKKQQCWTDVLQFVTQYKESDIRNCAKDLCQLLQNAPTQKLQSIRRKFASEKYLEISRIEIRRV